MAKASLIGTQMREPQTKRAGTINEIGRTRGDQEPIVRVGYRGDDGRPTEGWFLAREMIPMD